MANENRIGGIIPALVTPYSPDGTISVSALRAIVELCVSQGVGGFYACGSTAEAFLLSEEERMLVAETVVEAAGGRVPVIVHVGSISTAQAVRLARHAASCGAAAVSSIPPFYYNFRLDEIKAHYRAIIDSVDLPLIIYNFPAFSGVTLDSTTARDLLTNPRVLGIKHTSKDMFQLERMKQLRPDLVVLNGHDEVHLAGIAMGADGAVGSTFNILADRFVAISDHFVGGRLQEASALQRGVNGIVEVLISVGVFNGIKFLLKEAYGIEAGQCRSPFLPLTADQKKTLWTAWQAAGVQ
ncbi:N-acetylneuraminate lyase [Salinispira pacifica]